MNKKAIAFIALCFFTGSVYSQIINKEPLSQRLTGYKFDVKLDTAAKTVSGKMEAFWVNNSPEKVEDIRLHMYMNAFKSRNSTMFRESGGLPGKKESDRGWINLITLTDQSGKDLIPMMKYISPDDANPADSTVLQVMLPEPAKPGDTVIIKAEFETKLPSHIRRTGYSGEFFFIGQWFPKFGVYEPAGMRYRDQSGWNCHQFHANSEFFSNHSVYDVKITLPKRYVVGSGGMLMNESKSDSNLKTLTFRAEDIVDFAWTAWPGYKVFTDKWKHVNITLLLPAERTQQAGRQFIAVKNALEYLTGNVGPYPWPHLTFVDPPNIGAGAGGMEYTTLFTTMSTDRMPEWIHLPEMVTIHEFGHAYFMGILASNEFEEPWMDEGMNSFWEARIVDHYYGENSGLFDHPYLKISDKSYSRLTYVRSANRQLVSNKEFSWNFPAGTYSMMSYNKPTVWLYTLMGLIGEETMNEVYREYYRQWAFKYPSAKDFVNIVNEVVTKKYGNKFGPDMNWFFDETLYGTGICDYKATLLRNIKLAGKTEKEENDSISKNAHKDDSLYKAVVQVQRLGEVKLPVDVLVHFENGDEIMENWDGKDRYREFTYYGHGKVEWFKVDPEYKIIMDVNFINNSMTSDPYRVPVRRMADKVISIMQFCLSAITL
jgi:Peptidase family M1 domain